MYILGWPSIKHSFNVNAVIFSFSIFYSITAATIFTKKTIQYYYNLKYNTYSIASLLLYFTFNTVTINYNYT